MEIGVFGPNGPVAAKLIKMIDSIHQSQRVEMTMFVNADTESATIHNHKTEENHVKGQI